MRRAYLWHIGHSLVTGILRRVISLDPPAFTPSPLGTVIMAASYLLRARMLVYAPLVLHILPTLAIGLGIVIPGSCIAGVNQLTIGFAAAVPGFIPAYVVGVLLAQRRAPTHA
jgi:predicted membrane protein